MVQTKKKTMFDLDDEDEDDFVKVESKVPMKKKTAMPNILEEEEDDEFVPA